MIIKMSYGIQTVKMGMKAWGEWGIVITCQDQWIVSGGGV